MLVNYAERVDPLPLLHSLLRIPVLKSLPGRWLRVRFDMTPSAYADMDIYRLDTA